jgi:S1-C subfamily serine protease
MRHFFLSSLLFAILLPDYALSLTAYDIWNQFQSAVVKITPTGWKADGNRALPPEPGSGFIVFSDNSRTVLVTAAHVIKPDAYWDTQDGVPRRHIEIQGLNDNLRLAILSKNADVVAQDDKQDWAILQFNGKGYASVHAGTTIKPGKPAVLLGFPANNDVVNPMPGDVMATDFGQDGMVLRLYMPVTGGQSGGPIFDESGLVVAIASANERNSDYNFHVAVPMDLVNPALKPYVPDNAGFWSSPPQPDSSVASVVGEQLSYGLKLNSVTWKHNYKNEGDFEGSIIYDVTNASPFTISELLPDKAGWFGEQVEAAHKFLVFGDKSAFHNLYDSLFLPAKRDETYLDGGRKAVTYFIWLPLISPGLKPGENLKYGVRITTKGTERDALSDEGAYAGMTTPYPSALLSGEFNAPDDHTIVIQGYIIRDRSGSNLVPSHHGIEAPSLSDDGSRVRWRIEKPIPSAIYLLKLRFALED